MGADNTFGETNFNPTKKYFAKYFPVEGEIKDGKPAKLFLCSRHIEKGDLVYYDDVLNYNPSYKGEVAKASGEYIKCFKVIGEILTLGIIEGQEFTEKEIEFLTIGEKIS